MSKDTSRKIVNQQFQLTQRQLDTLEGFLKYGNAAKAAREAGYKSSNAHIAGHQVVTSARGKAYLTWRKNNTNKEKIASSDEVLEYLTKVMRGEVNDQFDLDAPLSERTRAATELAKRIIDATNNTDSLITINLGDIPKPKPKKDEKVKREKSEEE